MRLFSTQSHKTALSSHQAPPLWEGWWAVPTLRNNKLFRFCFRNKALVQDMSLQRSPRM
ncbi:MAG: hypothetical protein DSM106950_29910 [Stigonema ocellatum SAG 48.90 = DSM 106950]|nr:hypothetical protein [Stigonema ocellatum SAG 48.90 = DSM 106950]